MGVRFRKSINIGKNFRVNLSKSGVGFSAGVKGIRATKGADGRVRTTFSLPGTGLSYVREFGGKRGKSTGIASAITIVIIVVGVIAVLKYLGMI